MTNYGLVRVVLNTEIVSEPVPVKVFTTEIIHELDGKIRYYLIRDARDDAIGVTISGKPMVFSHNSRYEEITKADYDTHIAMGAFDEVAS